MYRVVISGLAFGASTYAYIQLNKTSKKVLAAKSNNPSSYHKILPSRAEILQELKNNKEFDILVIGGGATGCGVALDATTRGLKTALVEKYDFASGTSSRSTKLVHGGVRYLQNAILKLDKEQYHMVKEALNERANILRSAPHIATPVPILLPVYKWWQVPYYWVGIKMYDLVAGRQLVKKSYYLGKDKTLEAMPMLKKENLCGSIVYYDGQQDDARMGMTIALSAIRHGASVSNYVEVQHLLFKKVNDETKICGAHVKDNISGEEWDIKARCVVNATGPFTDSIRRMDNADTPKICLPASGIHITLPDYYSSSKFGLLDPATSDGRVIFFLPWLGKTIVGTTDRKCDITHSPKPSEDEIEFVLKEIQHYLSSDIKVRRSDVLSAWSGIRPLVLDPMSKDTKSVSRNHVIDISENKLVTIAGGKWTTYRAMAKDAVDAAVTVLELSSSASESKIEEVLLEGADGWDPMYSTRLVQQFGIEPKVAEHLSTCYGVKATQVLKLASMTNKRWPALGNRLLQDYPYIEAEVIYAVTNEYACTAVDMIARRFRIAFLDTNAAHDILPKVINIMGNQLKWDRARRKAELEDAKSFLLTMGSRKPSEEPAKLTSLSTNNVETYTKIFNRFDLKGTGTLDRSDLVEMFKTLEKRGPSEDELKDILSNSVDQVIVFNTFLQFMVSVKDGNFANNPLGVLIQKHFFECVTSD